MQAVKKNIKKNKMNCSTCVNRTICLAEKNVDPYVCIRDHDLTSNFEKYASFQKS